MYEYKVIALTSYSGDVATALTETLNEFARSDWRMIAVIQDVNTGVPFIFLERAMHGEQDA